MNKEIAWPRENPLQSVKNDTKTDSGLKNEIEEGKEDDNRILAEVGRNRSDISDRHSRNREGPEGMARSAGCDDASNADHRNSKTGRLSSEVSQEWNYDNPGRAHGWPVEVAPDALVKRLRGEANALGEEWPDRAADALEEMQGYYEGMLDDWDRELNEMRQRAEKAEAELRDVARELGQAEDNLYQWRQYHCSYEDKLEAMRQRAEKAEASLEWAQVEARMWKENGMGHAELAARLHEYLRVRMTEAEWEEFMRAKWQMSALIALSQMEDVTHDIGTESRPE